MVTVGGCLTAHPSASCTFSVSRPFSITTSSWPALWSRGGRTALRAECRANRTTHPRSRDQAMIEASCHCGSVKIEIPRKPRTLTDCNCSICRRYGTLWAYFRAIDVRIRAKRGATVGYSWGDRRLRFVRCRNCGCVTHWEHIRKSIPGRVGVNARNLDPAVLSRARIRRLDGASTWKFLD